MTSWMIRGGKEVRHKIGVEYWMSKLVDIFPLPLTVIIPEVAENGPKRLGE